MRDSNNTHGFFTGTIDEFLEHCYNMSDSDQEILDPETEQHIEMLMEENDMTREEVINSIQQQILQQELDKLVAEGSVEIVGTDEDGNPLYQAVKK